MDPVGDGPEVVVIEPPTNVIPARTVSTIETPNAGLGP